MALSKHSDDTSDVVPEAFEEVTEENKTRKIRALLEEKLEQQRMRRDLDVWDLEFDDWNDTEDSL